MKSVSLGENVAETAAKPISVTSVPVSRSLPEHPLADVIGIFADDPLWEEFLAEMERSRREIDAEFGLTE